MRNGALEELKAAIRELAEFVDENEPQLISYGEPSEKAVGQLRDKARLLGSGEVTVHAPHAGFGRFALRERPASVTHATT